MITIFLIPTNVMGKIKNKYVYVVNTVKNS